MRIEIFLALAFLREGPLQTLLLIVGATIGITVVFFITALITAVEVTMIAQTLDVMPHVVVRRADDVARPLAPTTDKVVFDQVHRPAQRLRSVPDWQPIAEYLRGLPGVRAVSVTASGPAMALEGRASRAVSVIGVVPWDFARVIAIEPRIVGGSLDVGGDRAVIGVELADDLGLQLGDRFRLVGADNQRDSFAVAGIFDMGNADVNQRWVVVSLRSGQTLLDIPGGVSTIAVRLADIWQADAVAGHIQERLDVATESWMETSSQLMVAIQSQRGATLMIRVFIMLAVAMGIASVLIVSTVQKSRQIGILRAMGMARIRIVKVFLFQGAAIGLAGAGFGCGLGTLLALASEASTTTPQGTPMYPIELPISLYLVSAAIALGTGLVAAALPSRRAARLQPVEAIRHE